MSAIASAKSTIFPDTKDVELQLSSVILLRAKSIPPSPSQTEIRSEMMIILITGLIRLANTRDLGAQRREYRRVLRLKSGASPQNRVKVVSIANPVTKARKRESTARI